MYTVVARCKMLSLKPVSHPPHEQLFYQIAVSTAVRFFVHKDSRNVAINFSTASFSCGSLAQFQVRKAAERQLHCSEIKDSFFVRRCVKTVRQPRE